jgi:hypothetical protein
LEVVRPPLCSLTHRAVFPSGCHQGIPIICILPQVFVAEPHYTKETLEDSKEFKTTTEDDMVISYSPSVPPTRAQRGAKDLRIGDHSRPFEVTLCFILTRGSGSYSGRGGSAPLVRAVNYFLLRRAPSSWMTFRRSRFKS